MTRCEPGLLHVRVQPRASRDALVGWQGDILRVRVTAPPTDGRANDAVAELLARACAVSPSSVELVRGAAARDKLFRIARLGAADVRARLDGALR